MAKIKLYGELSTQFGPEFDASVNSVAEAIRCLMCNLPGFKSKLVQEGEYAVYVDGRNITEGQLIDPTGDSEIQIVPVLSGASNAKGVINTIVGAVLVAVGAYTGQAWLVNIGLSLAISGAVSLLMPVPNSPTTGEVERSDNFLLSGGSRNDTLQGRPVPVGYGYMRITPRPISGGITTKDY